MNASHLATEPHGFRHYMRSHFLDTTFKGLYHANAFDRALLIPYFIVLILLAFYGLHRYQLVYLYYKHRKNAAGDPTVAFRRAAKRHDPTAHFQRAVCD